jgi:hypothetical protein
MADPIYSVEDLAEANRLKALHEEAARKYRELHNLPADTVLTLSNVRANTPEGFAVVTTGRNHALHIKWMGSEEYQALQRKLAR